MSSSWIRKIVKIDDCLDSTDVREVELVIPLDENLMRKMADDATLKYYPHFPRPYFRIENRRQFVAQGVIGNRTFRVTFLPNRDKDAMERLWEILGGKPTATNTRHEGTDSLQEREA
jgi:hypothetical protein